MKRLSNFLRIHEWWNVKVSLFYGVLTLFVFLNSLGPDDYLKLFYQSFLVLFPIAAWANIVNDFGDLKSDADAGKANRLQNWNPQLRIIVTFGTIPLLFIFPILFSSSKLEYVWISTIILCFGMYSLKPFRLKGKAWAGALMDALGTQVFPAFFIISKIGNIVNNDNIIQYVFIGIWLLFSGIRLHLVHQYMDRELDSTSNIQTIFVKYSKRQIDKIVYRLIIPTELCSLIIFIIVFKTYFLFAFLLVYFIIQYVLNKKMKIEHVWYAVNNEERVWLSEFYNYYILFATITMSILLIHYNYIIAFLLFLILFLVSFKSNILEIAHIFRWWKINN